MSRGLVSRGLVSRGLVSRLLLACRLWSRLGARLGRGGRRDRLLRRSHRRRAHQGLRSLLGRWIARIRLVARRRRTRRERHGLNRRNPAVFRRLGGDRSSRLALQPLHLGERRHVGRVARRKGVDETRRSIGRKRRLLRGRSGVVELDRRWGLRGTLRGAFGHHRRHCAVVFAARGGKCAAHRGHRKRAEEDERRTGAHREDRRERLLPKHRIALCVERCGTGGRLGAVAVLHGNAPLKGALPCARSLASATRRAPDGASVTRTTARDNPSRIQSLSRGAVMEGNRLAASENHNFRCRCSRVSGPTPRMGVQRPSS